MTRFAFVTTLTLGRAPLVLLGTVLLLLNFFRPCPTLLAAGLVLCALSAVTDLFDGMLARRWNVTSRFGALADPLMDKAFFMATLPVATFGALYVEDVTHAIALLVLDLLFLFRDQWVTFLRATGGGYGAEVKAALPGKIRTFLSFPGILLVHLRIGQMAIAYGSAAHEDLQPFPATPVYAVEAVLAVLTIWTCAHYTRVYMPFLRKAAAERAGAHASGSVPEK